jgi:hypothetical protein
MNVRTSIFAVGLTLALAAPAAASARAVTNQAGDTYFFTEHSQTGKQSQATQTFFTEHSLGFASHSGKKATHAIVEKRASGKASMPTIKPETIGTSSGPTSVVTPSNIDATVTMVAPSTTVDPSVDQSIDPNAC